MDNSSKTAETRASSFDSVSWNKHILVELGFSKEAVLSFLEDDIEISLSVSDCIWDLDSSLLVGAGINCSAM